MTVRRPDLAHPLEARYSRPGGPWEGPALDGLLSQADGRHLPDGTLVVDGDERLDAAALEDVVASVAGGLRAHGVRHGDVVSWQLANGAAALVLYRACWRLGAVATSIHHQAPPAEVIAIEQRLDPSVTISADGLPSPQPTYRLPTGDAASVLEALGAEADPRRGRPRPIAPGDVDVDPTALAAVLFTSGSSGRPKGVLHTHRALAGKARAMVGAHGLTADDAVLMPAPLAHVSGLLNGVLLPGAVPMKTVLMHRWDPERALELIEDEQITFMVGPPTFFLGLLDAPSWTPGRTASLRLVSCGGAGVTPAFAEDAARRLGATVKRSYGSTEAPTVTTSTPNDPSEAGWHTDGRPVGDAEVRIAPEGEVEVRGPEVFAGYLDVEDEADAFSADGERWFRTGDLGRIDGEGRLTITGRRRDLVIRAGENVAPGEVEGVLESHPDVSQAAVVGAPDERVGERVVAFVVTTGPFDLAACRAWFAEQEVARFKTPERVEVVDALPLLASGKPDRRALEALLHSPWASPPPQDGDGESSRDA